MAAQVVRVRHRPPARRLDADELELRVGRRARLVNAEEAAVRQRDAGDDVGLERADDVDVLARRSGEVQGAVLGGDLLGVRDACLGLGDRLGSLVERPGQQAGAEVL
jgi:hypothetical protein